MISKSRIWLRKTANNKHPALIQMRKEVAKTLLFLKKHPHLPKSSKLKQISYIGNIIHSSYKYLYK